MRVDGRIRWLAIAAVAGFGAALLVVLASLVGLGDLTLAAPTAVIVATVVLMNHLTNDRLRRAGKRSQASLAAIERRTVSIATRVRGLEATIHEAGAMAVLSPTATPYPLPLGGNWALAWDAAVVLAREVGLARPSVVVELGSGGSSLVIGKQLSEAGSGHLYSLDHEPAFAALTRRHLAAHDLEAWVTVLDAPLVELDVRGERFRWYDLPPEVRALPRVDVLVVDGPPQAIDRTGLPRYPALPAFREQLHGDAFVFVDDAYRDAERQMVERWVAEEPGWVAKVVKTSRGTAILRRQADGSGPEAGQSVP